ncbi:uncharacterized protein LOC110709148 [Chenopodium quinoa]|uniref:uncharacterized protein LOC110709148 n=1 Tax=Chenopodium quinoa TaxID=63459 RepID=UPI000B793A21|nr:uncharacterized protein LOC110709148 [Chenopodium quinoa]
MDMDMEELFSIEQLLEEEQEALSSDSSLSSTYSEDEYAAEWAYSHILQNQQTTQQGEKRRDLTIEQKRQIVDVILLKMQGGDLPRGFLSQQARQHDIHRSTMSRLYVDIKKQMAQGNIIDVRSKKLGRTGPKPKEYCDEWLQSVPLYKRTTERSYAGALNVSHSTIHRLRKKGRLRTHTSTNHPALTSNHKVARLKWVLSHINPIPTQRDPKFVDMQEVIHIDEKWFYLYPETENSISLQKRKILTGVNCQRGLIKAMFMEMIGKPIYARDGTLLHDGKYGIFPFVKKQMTKKKSKNKEAGTLETKAVQNVNKDDIREMLMEHIIPAIHQQWPESVPKNVKIQWDNARPHQIPKDEECIATCHANGLFKAIQSLQYQSFPTTLDDLIKEVINAYNAFEAKANKYIWLTLQSVMIKVLEKQGGNNFSPPHMKKKKIDKLGVLPKHLHVPRQLIHQAVNYLDTMFIPTTNAVDDQQMEVDAD